MADNRRDLASVNHDLEHDLGRRLRAARYLSGKKVEELAREAGWSKEKVYRLEQGRQVPDALELKAIAELTGQSLEFFFGSSPDPENGPILPSPLPLVNEGGAS